MNICEGLTASDENPVDPILRESEPDIDLTSYGCCQPVSEFEQLISSYVDIFPQITNHLGSHPLDNLSCCSRLLFYQVWTNGRKVLEFSSAITLAKIVKILDRRPPKHLTSVLIEKKFLEKCVIAKLATIPTLRLVSIAQCSLIQDDPDFESLVALTQIRKLDVCSAIMNDPRLSHLAQLKNLEKLELDNLSEFKQGIAPSTFLLIGTMTNLKTLNISRCDLMKDSVLERLTLNLPNITKVDFSYCSHITTNGLKKIARFERLKSLRLQV